MRPATLDDYRWLYQHGYMTGSRPWHDPPLLWLIDKHPKRILDVGSGSGRFREWMESRLLDCRVSNLDPASGGPFLPLVPESNKAECVTCFDVLEHLDEPVTDAALSNLRALSERLFVCSIANMSDVHTVNGEDVELHLTRMPVDWWLQKINKHFQGWDLQLHALGYHYRFWITAEA